MHIQQKVYNTHTVEDEHEQHIAHQSLKSRRRGDDLHTFSHTRAHTRTHTRTLVLMLSHLAMRAHSREITRMAPGRCQVLYCMRVCVCVCERYQHVLVFKDCKHTHTHAAHRCRFDNRQTRNNHIRYIHLHLLTLPFGFTSTQHTHTFTSTRTNAHQDAIPGAQRQSVLFSTDRIIARLASFAAAGAVHIAFAPEPEPHGRLNSEWVADGGAKEGGVGGEVHNNVFACVRVCVCSNARVRSLATHT